MPAEMPPLIKRGIFLKRRNECNWPPLAVILESARIIDNHSHFLWPMIPNE